MSGQAPAGVLGVIRTSSTDQARLIAHSLFGAGVPFVEITLTVPDASELIGELTERYPGRVGAGTVLDASQATAVAAAGAAFLVAPNTDLAVVRAAAGLQLPMIAGALTPTEITAALQAGCAAVKVFPVGSVGGATYIQAIRDPLPEAQLVVSGGITAADARRYLRLGVRAVCLGGALVDKSALAAGDRDALTRHAQAVLGTVSGQLPAGNG